MTTLTTARLRAILGDTLDRIALAHARVVVTKHGKPVAALVPIEDLETLRAHEDRIDLEAAREALAEPGASRPWTEVKAELGP